MDLVDALILGIIEGLTEFLPISSTGHLILAGKLLGLKQTEFVKTFDIAIQLGAILSVIVFERKRLIKSTEIWKRIIIAFVPTGIVGFILYKIIKGVFLESYTIVVISLIAGGFILILADRYIRKEYTYSIENIPLLRVFFIGLFQSIAVIPGVSRSGATIIGGLLMGLGRKESAEFSFMLAVPTMFAATSYDILRTGADLSKDEWHLLFIGFFTAFVVALLTMKIFLSYLNKHGFLLFGVYRILLGVIYYSVFIL